MSVTISLLLRSAHIRTWFEELSVVTPLKIFHSTPHFSNLTKDRLAGRQHESNSTDVKLQSSLDALDMFDANGYVTAPPPFVSFRLTCGYDIENTPVNLGILAFELDNSWICSHPLQ